MSTTNDSQSVGLQSVDELLEALSQAEALVENLKDELRQLPRRLAEVFTAKEQRTAIATRLYWFVPEITVNSIAEHLLGCRVHEVPSCIGSQRAEINCDRCGEQLLVMSRAALIEAQRKIRSSREGFRAVCENCRIAITEQRRNEWAVYSQEIEARLVELRSMPYRDYLLTPEWKSRRAKHLKSASYRCQLCNSGEHRLEVHHRTYARRGNEYFKDLIVLCYSCHEIFHAHSRVTKDTGY